MSKKINLRLVKPTKRYTVKELAKTLNVTVQSIYWYIYMKDLRHFHSPKTHLCMIWGKEFIKFIKDIRLKRKQKHSKGSVKCFHCQKFVMPADNKITIDNTKINEGNRFYGTILLEGLCPKCNKHIYQISNISKMEELKSMYKIENKPEYKEEKYA